MKTTNKHIKNSGSTIIMIIAFSAIFAIILAGISNMAVGQNKLLRIKEAKSIAFDMAESGLEYAEWFFSRFPTDLQDGTGAPGPYVHTVKDPVDGSDVGTFSLSVSATKACGDVQYIDITSQGASSKNQAVKKTLKARLLKPSVANFSYIIDSDVWAGGSRNIIGPYHSNGGIRMDGTNNSTVTSAQSTWWCDSSFGCDPAQSVPGVFGSGSGSALWKYPVNEINFNNFQSDFGHLKSLAQNNGGIFLSRFTSYYYGYDSQGYQLIFKSDGTVDVYQVYGAYTYWGYRSEYGYDYSWYYGWRQERNQIYSKSFIGNYTLPSTCSLIYSEEKLWIEGVVNGKVAVVAARDYGYYKPEIVLNDDIAYQHSDGTDGLTAIAQSYIIIPEYSPNNMTLNGVFVAQNGSFGRSYYSDNIKNTLTINGTVVSKKRVGTAWACGSTGYLCSGYSSRVNSYDRFLRNSPPPFTPAIADDYLMVNWGEVQ